MRILIVEDQPDLAATVGDYLTLHQYQVDYAVSGEAALTLIQSSEYDAMLLDINLPRQDGLDVCRALRASGCMVPVLMLTARDTLEDIVAGFEQGADDYLIKPFALEELLARLRAVTLRGSRSDIGTLQVSDLELDLQQQTARRAGCALNLNPLQFQLLKALALASPAVVGRDKLEAILWADDIPQPGALRMQMHRLRSIVDQGSKRALIATVRGHGFRIGE